MQYFTRQQIQGAQKYTGRTFIGNWNEDFERRDMTIRGVLTNHETGATKIDAHNAKLARNLSPMHLVPGKGDGAVRFGDAMQLIHIATGSIVASDLDKATAECTVTATRNPETAFPCPRTTFSFQPYEARRANAYDLETDTDCVCFGHKVYVALNNLVGDETADEYDPRGGDQPLFMASAAASKGFFGRGSRHQLVTVSGVKKYDDVWMIVHPVVKKRIEMEGQPLMSGEPFVLVHCLTGNPLFVEKDHSMLTDFGQELEVTCHIDRAKLGTIHAMRDEWLGADVPAGNCFLVNNSSGDYSAAEGPSSSSVPEGPISDPVPKEEPARSSSPAELHPAITRLEEQD